MSEIKRPKRCRTTHIRSMSGTVEYSEGCPGRKEDGKCRAAERADSASHVEGADAQGKCRAAGKAANTSHSASHVGGADGADDAQCKYHAVEGIANHAQRNSKSNCRWNCKSNCHWSSNSNLISGWRCFKSTSNGDSSGSPGQGGAESSSRGNCE